MPTYLSPGVYVEEVESGSKPIEGVGTAVAAFVGLASKGPANTPTLVTNWTQYVGAFGDMAEGTYLGHAVYGFFQNGGGTCYVVRVGADGDAAPVAAIETTASARLGGLEVRALEAGPAGNDITVEVADPADGAPEDSVRIVVTRGDEREEFDAVPTKGRAAITGALARSKLIRVEAPAPWWARRRTPPARRPG